MCLPDMALEAVLRRHFLGGRSLKLRQLRAKKIQALAPEEIFPFRRICFCNEF